MKSQGKREWSVYLVECADGSLYTGITKDVQRRVAEHNKGTGAAYTRSHRPVTLVYAERGFTRSKALIREAQIKRRSRPQKIKLVQSLLAEGNPRRKKATDRPKQKSP